MTRSSCPGFTGTAMVILTLLTCSVLILAPGSAVTQHIGSGPSFTAMVSGDNEFVPGEDTTITILVKNTGLNSMKQVMMGTIQPEDQQNTAKTTTIGLASAGDNVTVRTDPQMVGDIPGGATVPVQYKIKISANATDAEYQLPLTLQYRYLKVIVQERSDMFEYVYNDAEDTVPVTIRMQPHVKAQVIEAVPEQLTVGSDGYLNLKIRNIGPENGTLASVKLLRNGQSPIIPVDSTVFIGDFKSGDTIACRYKVSVSNDATNQTYPVDLAVSYMNREGTVVTSAKTTIGVPVNEQPVFTVISPVPEVPRGTESTINVSYRNNGKIPVYDTQARITPHDPVTASDSNAFLGDIAPGETATATFVVLADQNAETGEQTFDSTIRYRDATGISISSDPIPVQLNIVPSAGGISPLIIVGIIAVLIIGAAFFVYRQKNKSR
ncbi:MAG: S-layer protein [Methanoregulaceae archaeon]|nr:MAG: S-layer protein [Methanoregulaceae archaeon]